jgi:ATP-dependent Clp protease ATP-binding subunit ClpB
VPEEPHGPQRRARKRLDLARTSPRASQFTDTLAARIVGQERAVRALGGLYQVFLAGLIPAHRPIGTMLFLGPTGAGKTRVAEAAAEVLFGTPQSLIKIDCAEFQHGHEIAKLIGPPPGYVGHRESQPLLSQENIDRHQTPDARLSILLFDEIEKASESLWQLLLGILDRATLTLGDNSRVDFSRCIIILTSNLGAREMADAVSRERLGFGPSTVGADVSDEHRDKTLSRAAVEAARRRFSPEFMNRIDKTVVFHGLDTDQLRQVLDLELAAIQQRLLTSGATKFLFECTEDAKAHILKEGTDTRYGARHLKRAIERLLVLPLSTLMSSGQVNHGDVIEVDFDELDGELHFCVTSTGAAFPLEQHEVEPAEEKLPP